MNGKLLMLVAGMGMVSGCASETQFVDGEKIARIANSSGIYAVHDHENKMLCYVAVQKQLVRSSSIAISCLPYQE